MTGSKIEVGQMGFSGRDFSSPPPEVTRGATMELGIGDGETERKVRSGFRRVRIDDLNIIAQAREEYEGIEVLADAIKEAGFLIHTPLVAQFDKQGARRYLAYVQGVYADKLAERKNFSDLIFSERDGERAYYVVIAGHRRLRALRILKEEEVDIKVVLGIDPLHALMLQAQENTPRLLKDYERADQHGALWKVSKVNDPNSTQEEFAKRAGVTPAVLRRDLRYYDLPVEIKNYVVPRGRRDIGEGNTLIPDQPLMPFSVACQLGRLVEAGAPINEVNHIARNFFRENIRSEKTASKRVSSYLEAFKLGSQEMVDIFGVNLAKLARVNGTRQTANLLVPAVGDAQALVARFNMLKGLGMSDRVEDGLVLAGALKHLQGLSRELGDFIASSIAELDPESIELIQRSIEEIGKLENTFSRDNEQD